MHFVIIPDFKQQFVRSLWHRIPREWKLYPPVAVGHRVVPRRPCVIPFLKEFDEDRRRRLPRRRIQYVRR